MIAYRPDIDGLRALAVLSLVLFHAGVPFFSGGYVGVDIFFVISGFLIVALLKDEMQSGAFSMAGFFERRLRRLVPALVLMLGVTSLFAALILIPSDLQSYGRSLIGAALLIPNILFWRETGYFSAQAEDHPLLHLWSLGVEAQFYLLVPFFMFWLYRKTAKTAGIVCFVLFALSFAMALWGAACRPVAAFYLFPPRMWEFMLGGLLAAGALPRPSGKILSESLAVTGLGLILFAILFYAPATPYPGLNTLALTLATALGTALLLYSGMTGQNMVLRALGFKPLVFIGLISYSLYLWHWPILVLVRYALPAASGTLFTALALGLSLLLSFLTWQYVEKPFRRQKAGHHFYRAAASAGLVFLGTGMALMATNGLPWRLDPTLRTIEREASAGLKTIDQCIDQTPLPRPTSMPAQTMLCRLGDTNAAPDFILLGDSHAMGLQAVVSALLKENGRAGYLLAHQGCPFLPDMPAATPSPEQCRHFTAQSLAFLQDHPAIRNIMLAARWSYAVTDAQDAGQTPDKARIKAAADSLASLTRTMTQETRRVTILTPIPEAGYHVPKHFIRTHYLKQDHDIRPSRADYDARHRWFFDMLPALRQNGATILHSENIFCDHAFCAVQSAGRLLYWDDNHLGTDGGAMLRPLLMQSGIRNQ